MLHKYKRLIFGIPKEENPRVDLSAEDQEKIKRILPYHYSIQEKLGDLSLESATIFVAPNEFEKGVCFWIDKQPTPVNFSYHKIFNSIEGELPPHMSEMQH